QEPGQGGRRGHSLGRTDAAAGCLAQRPSGDTYSKLTIPEVPDLYIPLINHERVARVVALSGGYTRAEAGQRLLPNHGMIASFSRALAEGLTHSMSDDAFNATLGGAIDQIFLASTAKI